MSSLEAAMLKTLNAQLNGYEKLFELLKKEKGLLIAFDVNGVEELSKEKDTLVLRLRLLEEERFRIQKKLVMEMSLKTMDDTHRDYKVSNGSVNLTGTDVSITLRTLYELTGIDDFNAMRLKLVSLVQGIDEINDFNKILIDRSLSYINPAVTLYSSFGFNSNAYNIGNLIRREA